ncbi:MAG: histidine phosphatase family protein, partial [Erysipelotrichaceae bacterium]|nr:histidine phosphatase family protein [Erysipelotrichaceae bacterium]
MKINIIRHSTTLRNEEGLATGPGIDVPLSPKGIRIIEDLKAQGIYPEEPGVLYGSALSRTVETLNIIYPGRAVIQR